MRADPHVDDQSVSSFQDMSSHATQAIPGQASCNVASLWASIRAFERWLDNAGYDSYDPYDIWGTKYGIISRRLYYRQPVLGLPLIAPILLMEILCPGLRAWFVRKHRYPTADAQLALAFLNLYELSKDAVYLDKAVRLCEQLLSSSIPGYSGHCWGYPFDWQHVGGLACKGTPFITATPYCFEAFSRLFDVTENSRYLKVAHSVAAFVSDDLKDTPAAKDAMAGSYSPDDASKVINASAYRAYVLFEAACRFGVEAYADKGWKNLRFILQSQRSDGSWLYSVDNPDEAFIDHFHTCFVLKNLCKINMRLQDATVRQAIQSGFSFYRRELFQNDGLPKSFAIQPRTQIVRVETYNLAEAITLGVLLRKEIPEASKMLSHLGFVVQNSFQLTKGYFVTRRYIGGITHSLPFLRWPQAQMFYAMTNLLTAFTEESSRCAGWSTPKPENCHAPADNSTT